VKKKPLMNAASEKAAFPHSIPGAHGKNMAEDVCCHFLPFISLYSGSFKTQDQIFSPCQPHSVKKNPTFHFNERTLQ